MEKTIIARLSIKPECIEQIKQASKELITKTRKEEGCLIYNLYQSLENPSDFIFYEKYKNEEATQLHGSSEYLTKFLEIVKDSSQAKVEIEVF